MAASSSSKEPALDAALLRGFLADGGLDSNGTVPVYMPVTTNEGTELKPAGAPYELRSIAWRFLEDIGVGIAAYNTPKTLHCLSPNQQMETFLVLEHAKLDPRVRALVWTGTGTRSFSSGAALKGDKQVYVPEGVVAAYRARGMAPSGDMVLSGQTRAFWDFPKPLVIAVNGLAVGGGANIALANFGDLVLCSRNARFMYPFAKLGLTPELGSSMVLPFVVGMAKAKELLMLGDWFSAEEAHRIGFASAVYEPEELLPKAVTIAARVAACHPTTMRLTKQIINAPLRDHLDAVLARELTAITESIRVHGGFRKAISAKL